MKSFQTNNRLPVGWAVALAIGMGLSVQAYPPAPHHLFYGQVRDGTGNPLQASGAEVILETGSGVQVKALIGASEPGVNYRLPVPMDAGITDDLYKPTALRPTVPFKIKVRMGKTVYLPIEMRGDYSKMGQPGASTRLDLTLGEDADGDGLPDAWERALISESGGKKGLGDIRPGDDFDGDGLSNFNEYLAGTYAFDSEDGFSLKAVPNPGGEPILEFTAIRGRSYGILASDDFSSWTPISFTMSGEGAGARVLSTYQADDVRLIRAKPAAAPGGRSMRFYKLVVQ
ncbi:MAG: hypothetical protein AAB466_15070 [Verrucomicrobiota bacterium]